VVPDLLRFLASCITNDIARVLFIFGTLEGVVFVPVNVTLYWRVRRLLRSQEYSLR
jgi:hypothetical protein